MRLKDLILEDLCNYKYPSTFLVTAYCDWKCCVENNLSFDVCQNQPLVNQPIVDMDDNVIYKLHKKSDLSTAVVLGGLEPMLQFDEMLDLIKLFRNNGCDDTFVIYTGYYEYEIKDKISQLQEFQNIIIKFGRYVPDVESVYDNVLGVTLISNNQYAKKIS